MAVRGPPSLGERELFAEYPFLPGAESLGRELGLSLRDLFNDPVYARAQELGRARIRAAVDDPTGSTGVDELLHATPEERFLSFLFARLVLSAAPTRAPLRRWAVAEAKLGWNRLRSSEVDELSEVARRLGFPIEGNRTAVTFGLPDYLRLATPIREGEYRLVQQTLRGGRVEVRTERAARLLQEGVRVRLAQPMELDDDVRALVTEREGAFLKEVGDRIPAPSARAGAGVGPLLPDRFPPCIRKMRRALNDGENLSHSGRFALAAFLNRCGADFDTIVDAYRGAPDFDEGITRYQVEHITRRSEGAGYEPPVCETLRSHGLCLRDGDPTAPTPGDRARDPICFEERLRHPLQYYRIRGGSTVERASDVEVSSKGPGGGSGRRPGPG
jgi:DNA primase large subunit